MKLYSLSQVEHMSPCTKPNDRFYGTINLKYKPSLTFKKPFFVQHRHSFIHTWKILLETWKERIGLPFLNKSMDFFMAFPNLSTNPKCPKGLRKYLNFCNFRCGVLAFFEKIFGWFVLNSAGRCWHQARDFTSTKVQQIFLNWIFWKQWWVLILSYKSNLLIWLCWLFKHVY